MDDRRRQDGADPCVQTDEAIQVRPKEWTFAHSVGVPGCEETTTMEFSKEKIVTQEDDWEIH